MQRFRPIFAFALLVAFWLIGTQTSQAQLFQRRGFTQPAASCANGQCVAPSAAIKAPGVPVPIPAAVEAFAPSITAEDGQALIRQSDYPRAESPQLARGRIFSGRVFGRRGRSGCGG